jgi:hypothetical protein
MPKPAPSLGFALEDLDGAVSGYEQQPKASKADTPPPEPAQAPVQAGRPRTLARDAQPVSIRLDGEQRKWLLAEAARRTLDSGERHDVSRIIRELIDQAREASG